MSCLKPSVAVALTLARLIIRPSLAEMEWFGYSKAQSSRKMGEWKEVKRKESIGGR